MLRSTSTLQQAVALVALANYFLLPANAAFTLPITETTVTRAQRQDGASTEGMAAAAGGARNFMWADAWFSLMDESIVLTVDVGLGADTGGGVYKMVVDSASPYLWAATPSCEGCKVAPEIKRYDMGTSQSYVRANWTVASYSYAIGAVGGAYATETFSLGPYRAENVSFAGIDQATTWPFDTQAKNVVGLLPLGHGSAKVTDAYGQESQVQSPLMSLYYTRAIDDPVVGVVIQGDTPQLTIGGIDEYWTKNMDGHVTLSSHAQETYYQIPMDNVVTFGNTTILASSGDTAIIDTAASHIFGPWDKVEEIYKKFEGMRYTDPLSDDKSTYYAVPCKEPEGFSLSFGFGGKQFPVKYEALVNTQWPVQRYVNGVLDTSVYQDGRWCHGNLQETTMLNFSDGKDTSDRRWLMGLSFLRNVYAGFNFVSGEISLWPLIDGLNNTIPGPSIENKGVDPGAVPSGSANPWGSDAASSVTPADGYSVVATGPTESTPTQTNGGLAAVPSSDSPTQGIQRRRGWRG